jgi:hypothetical protein
VRRTMRSVLCTCRNIGVVLVIVFATQFYLLDGLDGWLWRRVTPDTTLYATNYTDKAYRRIQRGMTQEEVLSVLGQPLKVSTEDHGKWRREETGAWMRASATHMLYHWSVSSNDGSYSVRAIEFKDGRVWSKRHEFYMD